MCYLVAKKFNQHGCIAVQAEYGHMLASLVDYLGRKTIGKEIQILTVSDMDMYGEYKPYNLVADESVFIQKVLNM